MELLPAANLGIIDRAIAKVRDRLLRASISLQCSNIPCVVIGANAVAEWMKWAEKGGERATPNVDFLIHRSDLQSVAETLEKEGWTRVTNVGVPTFLDMPSTSLRAGVRFYFADERYRRRDLLPMPGLDQSVHWEGNPFRHVNLNTLVEMKLVAHRTIDRVHIQDMASVNLIDNSWPQKFPSPLKERLQEILETPDAQYHPELD